MKGRRFSRLLLVIKVGNTQLLMRPIMAIVQERAFTAALIA
jgi:hypothetical protein